MASKKALLTSNIPKGDPSKLKEYSTTSGEAYTKEVLDQGREEARGKQTQSTYMLRATHFKLGGRATKLIEKEDKENFTFKTSVSSSAYKPPPKDFKPAKLMYKDLQSTRGRFPQGDVLKISEFIPTSAAAYTKDVLDQGRKNAVGEQKQSTYELHASHWNPGSRKGYFETTSASTFTPKPVKSFHLVKRDFQRDSLKQGDKRIVHTESVSRSEFRDFTKDNHRLAAYNPALQKSHFRLGSDSNKWSSTTADSLKDALKERNI